VGALHSKARQWWNVRPKHRSIARGSSPPCLVPFLISFRALPFPPFDIDTFLEFIVLVNTIRAPSRVCPHPWQSHSPRDPFFPGQHLCGIILPREQPGFTLRNTSDSSEPHTDEINQLPSSRRSARERSSTPHKWRRKSRSKFNWTLLLSLLFFIALQGC
jgi:hypothetical protein